MSLITVMRQLEMDVGHRVPDHRSKCRNIHGHRYKIQVEVVAPRTIRKDGDSERGMVMDFGIIKEILTTSIHDPFDHSLMLYDMDPLWNVTRIGDVMLSPFQEIVDQFKFKVVKIPVIPTAEELAQYWGHIFYREWRQALARQSEDIGAALKQFRVWETPNCYADYGPVEEQD